MTILNYPAIPEGFATDHLNFEETIWDEDSNDVVPIYEYSGRLLYIGKHALDGMYGTNILLSDDGNTIPNPEAITSDAIDFATEETFVSSGYNLGPGSHLSIGATITADSVGVYSIGGVAVTLGDTVLLHNQTDNLYYNGLYVMTTEGSITDKATFTRMTDYDTSAEVYNGLNVKISNGDTYRMNVTITGGVELGDPNYAITATLVGSGSSTNGSPANDGTHLYNILYSTPASNIILETGSVHPKVLIPNYLQTNSIQVLKLMVPNSKTDSDVINALLS